MSLIFFALVNPAQAQVWEPSWLYGKISQKTLKPHSKSLPDREVASLSGHQFRNTLGWKLLVNQPKEVKKKVLLLPGFLGTDYVYHSMIRDAEMAKHGIQLIAANPPGFAGLTVPKGFDFTIKSYASLVEKLATQEKIDILVGHSYMATVLTEVARRGQFQGKLVLISPSLEPDDEPLSTKMLDLVTRDPVMKDIVWLGMYAHLEEAFEDFFLENDTEHLNRAAAEARKTPISSAQAMLLHYFNYLRNEDHHFLKSLSQSPAEIHYVHGGKDMVQHKSENKNALLATGKVTIHSLPNASHMVMIDEAHAMNLLLKQMSR